MIEKRLEKTISSLIRKFKSDRLEYMKIMFLFGYLFCLVSASTIGRTAADTLFLSQYDASVLSYMYLPQAGILLLAGILYQNLCSRFRTDKLVIAVIIMVSVLALGSRVLIMLEVSGILHVIYIGYDVFNFLMVMSFWQFATVIMDQRKAKQTIGWVGSGGIVGGILSGFGLKLLVPLLGTVNLIYVYAFFQLLGLLFVMFMLKQISNRAEMFTVKTNPKKSANAATRDDVQKQGLFQLIPHLRYVAILAGTIVISLTLIDFQFKTILRESLQNEELAGFMGSFYGFSGLLALAVQFFISGKLITRFGVTTAILVFPFVLFTGSILLLIVPFLAVAALVKGSDKVLGDTIYSSVSQLIMFPIPPERRGQAKGFLDGIVRNGAKGIAAVSLILLAPWLSVEQFSYITIGLILCGIIAAIRIKKTYLTLLLSTLQSKTIHEQAEHVDLMDPASIQVMVEALHSHDQQQAMYAFQFLQSIHEFDMKPHIGQLLEHPSDEIKVAVLQYIQASVPDEVEIQLAPLLESPVIQIRSNAILAMAVDAKESNLARMIAFLHEDDIQIRSVAIAGLIKYYGIEGMFHAVGVLKEMLDSRHEEERMAMARLFGLIGITSFYKPLIPMLSDSSERVRIGALESAGQLRIPELISYLVPLLQETATREQTIEALAAYEEDVLLPLIKPYLFADEDYLHVPLVFESLMTQRAFDALLEGYGQMTVEMREKAIESATRMNGDNCSIDPAFGEYLVMQEMAIYWDMLEHSQLPSTDRFAMIREAAEEMIHRQVSRIFQLLSLIYDAKTIQAVFMNWSTGDARQQANAAEVMDQLLTGKLRIEMARIIAHETVLREGREDPDFSETQLSWLHRNGDPWLRWLIDHARSLSSDMAKRELNDEPLERVRLLKNVPLFGELTGRDLYNISRQLRPVYAKKDTLIIREMDMGDSLYLIKQGTAGIYKQRTRIGELGSKECFGEMAVITQGPRTATIVAEEDMELYQLTRDTFYNMLSERTEIALELMKLLSRRLRSMNARIPANDMVAERQQEIATMGVLEERKHIHTIDPLIEHTRNEQIARRLLALQQISLFSNCSQQDYIHLAQMVKENVYEAGENICRVGENGNTLFGIIEGQIRVHKGNEVLAVLEVGQSFGEMTIIDGEPRSANCTAIGRTVVIELTREQVITFCFQRIDVLKGIIRVLAERFQETHNTVTDLNL